MFDALTATLLRRCVGPLALIATLAVGAQGHPPPAGPASLASPASGASEPVLPATLLKTGLYLIGGEGGNALLRFSANGLILVDGKAPGLYRPLMSHVRKIARISDLPVRVLVLTNHHDSHAGNYATFVAAGVSTIAQSNALRRLSTGPAASASAAQRALHYDREYTLRLGGVELRLLHLGAAHSDGDTVVHFADLRVVAIGDLVAPGGPEPDYSSGGSLLGWGPALVQVLKLDFEIAVPGHGPPLTRAELEAFKSRVDALVSRASTLAKSGISKDRLLAQMRADEPGWRLQFTGDHLDRLYDELVQAR